MEEMSSRYILCSWLLVTICRCHNVVPREVDTLTPGQMLEKEFGMNLEQRKKYFLELFDKGNEEAKKRMEVEKAEAKKKIPVVMDKFRADLEENGEWVFQEVEKYKKSENPDLTCISAHIKDISAVSLKISTDVHQCIEKNLMKEWSCDGKYEDSRKDSLSKLNDQHMKELETLYKKTEPSESDAVRTQAVLLKKKVDDLTNELMGFAKNYAREEAEKKIKEMPAWFDKCSEGLLKKFNDQNKQEVDAIKLCSNKEPDDEDDYLSAKKAATDDGTRKIIHSWFCFMAVILLAI